MTAHPTENEAQPRGGQDRPTGTEPATGASAAARPGDEPGMPVHGGGTDAAWDIDPGAALVPPGDRETLDGRLQHALSSFVDNPRQAVEEADTVYDELVTQLIRTLTERRAALRSGWREDDSAGTEELRIALKKYREAGEVLLRE